MDRCPAEARLVCSLFAALSMALWVAPGSSAFAKSTLSVLDKDGDGTLDHAELKDAAGAEFDKLNHDNDGTLDAAEIGQRAGKAEFKDADPDHDGTLSKEEYLALAEKLFDEADANRDGVLSAKELQSKAGRALLHLVH